MISILDGAFLPCFYFIFIGQQKSISSNHFIRQCFYSIDLKLSDFPVALLVGLFKFDFYFCFRVRVDRVEQFLGKPSLTTTGKTKLFSSVIVMDISKEARNDHTKAISAIAHAACSRLDEPKFFRSQEFPP